MKRFKVVLKEHVDDPVYVEADAFATGQQYPMLYFVNYHDDWKDPSTENGKKPPNVKEVSGLDEIADMVATFHAGEWLYVVEETERPN